MCHFLKQKIYLILFLFFFFFATTQHMESRREIRSEPQLQHLPKLHQCQIFNLLCQARDQICISALPRRQSRSATAGAPIPFFLTVFTASYFMDIISSLSEDTNNFCFVFSSALCTISFKHFGLLVHSGLPLLSWRVPSNIW